MAGRNISASKMAMGSTRVMGTCAVGGQAVGTAAAMCIKYACCPRDIKEHIDELQQTLLKDDCYIPGIKNHDENDFALKATVEATSTKDGCDAWNVINGISRAEGDNNNIWVSNGIGDKGETLTLTLPQKQTVSQVRLTFDSNFNYAIKITMSDKRKKQQRIGVPQELVKDYVITLWNENEIALQKTVTDNVQRANTVDFPPTACDRITVTVKSTNGAEDVRIYEIRVY